MLKPHQRMLIPTFARYNVRDNEDKLNDEDVPYFENEFLTSLEDFDPENDPVDGVIWT